MAHSYLTPTKVIRAAMAEFQNNLSFVKSCKRVSKKDYEIGGMKSGAAVNVAVPNNFAVRTGANFSGQDLNERSVSVPVDTQYGVDINGVTTLDWTMNIDDFNTRFIKPAMANLAAKVEQQMLNIAAIGCVSQIGTPGSTPSALLTYLQCGQRLSEYAAPFEGRSIHITPAANAATVDAMKGLFNNQTQLGKQYEKGLMAKDTLGFDFYTNQAIPVLTCGSRATTGQSVRTTVAADGAKTLDLTLATSTTIKAGDVFTITGINSVNPLTKQSTGNQYQFVAAADVAAGTAVTVTLTAPIYASGGHANVTALPTSGTAVTFLGAASTAYSRNIFTVQDAVAFANVELQVPGGVDFAAAETVDGISLRVVRYYTGSADTISTRFDVAFGGAVLRPEWVGQLIGA